MNSYDSDKEQLEALRHWWKTNGRSVIAGLLLGLTGVLAWTAWSNYTHAQAEEASQRYDQLVALANKGDYPEAARHGERLIQDFPNSGYASLAVLILADAGFRADDLEAAKRHLRWAMAHGRELDIQQVARLRLARLLLDQQAYAEALSLLEGGEPGTFTAPYEEIRGDILAVQGQPDAARAAYQKALAALPPVGPNRDRVQMKLDDLGTLRYPSPVPPKASAPAQAAKEGPS